MIKGRGVFPRSSFKGDVMKKVRTRKAKDAQGIEEASEQTIELLEDQIDDMSDDEIAEIVDLSSDYNPGEKVVDAGEMVKINIPVSIKIKRKNYDPGVHEIPKHLLPVVREMLYKKRVSDLSMFVGKNYLIERLLDRTLVVKEVNDLDLKKL
jgi:hypothetical protein